MIFTTKITVTPNGLPPTPLEALLVDKAKAFLGGDSRGTFPIAIDGMYAPFLIRNVDVEIACDSRQGKREEYTITLSQRHEL